MFSVNHSQALGTGVLKLDAFRNKYVICFKVIWDYQTSSCPPELRVAQIKKCTHGSHVTLQNYVYKWIVIVHTDYGWLIQNVYTWMTCDLT